MSILAFSCSPKPRRRHFFWILFVVVCSSIIDESFSFSEVSPSLAFDCYCKGKALCALKSSKRRTRSSQCRTIINPDAVAPLFASRDSEPPGGRRPGEQQAASSAAAHLVFPGGGIFFYWQAGAVTYLREAGYDLSGSSKTGASAGALTATLTACSVDFYRATQIALDMSKEAGVWDRSRGLQGIWGPMIEDWLDRVLPENAVEMLAGASDGDRPRADRSPRERGELSLLVTRLLGLGGCTKETVKSFTDKRDLIRCNMASVHLPWFLDGKLTSEFRNGLYIDGSFLASERDYNLQSDRESSLLTPSHTNTLVFDYSLDPMYKSRGLFDFVKAFSPDTIWSMLEDGKRYAKYLEECGELESIPRN